jgi:hypothetical protein
LAATISKRVSQPFLKSANPTGKANSPFLTNGKNLTGAADYTLCPLPFFNFGIPYSQMETASQSGGAVAIHRLLDEIHLDIQAGISMDFSVGDQP